MKQRGFFVTGTDTGVGKTQVAGALLSLLADEGVWPFAFKPYETGVGTRPTDAAWLRRCAGGWQPLDSVCVHAMKKPLAPAMAGVAPWKKTVAAFATFRGQPVVVEGSGGLRVPLDPTHDVTDLAALTGLPVVLVGRAGLGTLNHTALSLELLARRRLAVAAVVLVKSTRRLDPSEAENPRWIRKHCDVPVFGPVPYIPSRARRHAALKKLLAPLV